MKGRVLGSWCSCRRFLALGSGRRRERAADLLNAMHKLLVNLALLYRIHVALLYLTLNGKAFVCEPGAVPPVTDCAWDVVTQARVL